MGDFSTLDEETVAYYTRYIYTCPGTAAGSTCTFVTFETITIVVTGACSVNL